MALVQYQENFFVLPFWNCLLVDPSVFLSLSQSHILFSNDITHVHILLKIVQNSFSLYSRPSNQCFTRELWSSNFIYGTVPGAGDVEVDKMDRVPGLESWGLENAVCGELIFSWVSAWHSKAFSG